jgi:hypothetical protein
MNADQKKELLKIAEEVENGPAFLTKQLTDGRAAATAP